MEHLYKVYYTHFDKYGRVYNWLKEEFYILGYNKVKKISAPTKNKLFYSGTCIKFLQKDTFQIDSCEIILIPHSSEHFLMDGIL